MGEIKLGNVSMKELLVFAICKNSPHSTGFIADEVTRTLLGDNNDQPILVTYKNDIKCDIASLRDTGHLIEMSPEKPFFERTFKASEKGLKFFNDFMEKLNNYYHNS